MNTALGECDEVLSEKRSEVPGSASVGSGHNPIYVNTPWTWRERVCLVPMAPVVVCRGLLVAGAFLLATGVVLVAMLFPKGRRRIMISPLRWLSRLVLLAFGFWWIHEEGRGEEGEREAGIICAAPHASLLDVLYLIYRWQPAFVAKKDVRAMPLIGWFAEVMHSVFVDRHANDATTAEYKTQIREMARDPGAPPVLVFPEGTCGNGESLLMFKRGAFEPGVGILPVCMRYHCPVNPAAVGLNSGWSFLLRVMFQWRNRLEVKVLPVYHPSGDETSDPVVFATRVQRLMSEASGLPCTRHTLADMYFQWEVTQDGFSADSFRFVFADLYENLDIQTREERRALREMMSHLLKRWKKMDADRDGLIDETEFLGYVNELEFEVSLGKLLFQQFDLNRDGRVEFLELAFACFALQRLAENGDREEPGMIGEREIRDAYRFYAGGLEAVSRSQVHDLLRLGCELSIPPEIERYFGGAAKEEGLGLDDFASLYREQKNYLMRPLAVACSLVMRMMGG